MSEVFFKKNYLTLLLILLFFAFTTRFFRLDHPQKYIFDEVYHAVTAKLIAQNDPRAYEWWNPAPEKDTSVDWLHPPLAKYTQALGIRIFGAHTFGWRSSSALFGVATIYLIAKLGLALTKKHSISLLAAFLASLDGLLLVMSRIAMNDIHVTFAILLTLIFYLKTHPFTPTLITKKTLPWYVLTGFTAGLAIGSKWSGVFVLGIIYFYETISTIEYVTQHIFKQKKKIATLALRSISTHLLGLIFAFILLPLFVYVISYTQMFLQGKDLTHFIELHKQIWWYQSTLTATHDYQSTPFQWLTNQRPVWFYVEYGTGSRADIYAHGNSIILWSGLVVVLLYSLQLLKKVLNATDSKKPLTVLLTAVRTPTAFLLISYYAMWIVWTQSPRIMFFYHYTPAIPFLVILLAHALYRICTIPKKRQFWGQSIFFIVLGLSLLYFFVFFPHWTSIPMKASFVENIYFFFNSWK